MPKLSSSLSHPNHHLFTSAVMANAKILHYVELRPIYQCQHAFFCSFATTVLEHYECSSSTPSSLRSPSNLSMLDVILTTLLHPNNKSSSIPSTSRGCIASSSPPITNPNNLHTQLQCHSLKQEEHLKFCLHLQLRQVTLKHRHHSSSSSRSRINGVHNSSSLPTFSINNFSFSISSESQPRHHLQQEALTAPPIRASTSP